MLHVLAVAMQYAHSCVVGGLAGGLWCINVPDCTCVFMCVHLRVRAKRIKCTPILVSIQIDPLLASTGFIGQTELSSFDI